jgi:hypothetical protein
MLIKNIKRKFGENAMKIYGQKIYGFFSFCFGNRKTLRGFVCLISN